MNSILKGIALAGLLWLATLTAAYSQKAPIKFGDVPIEDVKMTTYDKDSSAVAVILTDFGESSMVFNKESGFVLNFERITRIKILKKEGLEWANFSIQLYHSGTSDEKVSGLKGVTYNLENGKVVETKMKNEAVFREKYDENNDFVKVALPNVRAGSVVEITYKVMSDFIFNFQDWTFQSTIPVRWSEYRTRIPEYFTYDKYMQGYVVPSVNEQTQERGSITLTSIERAPIGTSIRADFQNEEIEFQEYLNRWVAKDVPAFKEEPYITTYKDYISKINFELAYTKFPNQPVKNYMGSWKEINDSYVENEYVGGVVKGNGHLKDNVVQLTRSAATPEEKVAIIHQYVRDNFQWDGTTRKFTDDPLRKVVEDKKGSSAELNLLMTSMLEKADIEVYPVLISTRDHGFIRDAIPVSSQFNNTICLAKVGTKQFLLDATQKLLPTGFLPERCLNGKGLVISKMGHSWVDLTSPVKSRYSITTELTFNSDDIFSGKLVLDRSGYFAEKDRKRYQQKGEKDYVKDLVGSNPWEITKSSVDNALQLTASFKETHELAIAELATIAGNQVYFNPIFIERMDENPFKLEKREYPVDFGSPFDYVHFSKINIPPDYLIEEIPSAKAIVLPNNGGKFLFSANQSNNAITITSSMQINRPLFSQEEYVALREFYSQVVAKHAEQVVLKKKQ